MNSNFKSAISHALRLISLRDYTEKELQDKLSLKFQNLNIEKVLDYLRKNGYISDYKVAFNYAISKMEKGWGRRKIKAYLLKKGISKEIAEQVLIEIEFDYSFIKKDFEKKFQTLQTKKEKERAFRFLQQRGFTYTEIINIISGKI
ncbi:regulatory protein RecX [Desulfurobacterium atlanticum]|uniref:Regulatory protein RecX n=1 Tax=Desulfurobacterium atlanticum TaxID=240169 RepID=A0A239A6T2_9BACT|nr:regulatory protein RecX [Desulfurobacterium atlanticum]SNR91376.1 regulatory protein [Desulfurobacterium atlanticum]